MKTAISVPDEIFARASARAEALGLSRSEFFARAADRYLDALDAQTLTDDINAALEHAAHDRSTEDAVTAGRRVLGAIDDTW